MPAGVNNSPPRLDRSKETLHIIRQFVMAGMQPLSTERLATRSGMSYTQIHNLVGMSPLFRKVNGKWWPTEEGWLFLRKSWKKR